MDSPDLLAREEEFRKLNKQLEKKTSSLMKEIEIAMHKQDIFSEFSHSLNYTPHTYIPKRKENVSQDCLEPKKLNNSIKYTKTIPENKKTINNKIEQSGNDTMNERNIVCDCIKNERYFCEDLEFLRAFVTVNVKDNVLPQSFLKDRYSVQSVCKYLSSQTKLLQDQIDKLQSIIDKKNIQCENHMKEHAELEGERMKMLNQLNCYRSEAMDYKNKYSVLQNKFTERERLYKEQRSDSDKGSAELKRLRVKNATVEAKCLNYIDEINRLKQQIETLKSVEKEFRDSSRSHSATQKTTISQQDKKINQLSQIIIKLNELIDNLKKQNYMLTTDIMMQGLEKEYSSFLLGDNTVLASEYSKFATISTM